MQYLRSAGKKNNNNKQCLCNDFHLSYLLLTTNSRSEEMLTENFYKTTSSKPVSLLFPWNSSPAYFGTLSIHSKVTQLLFHIYFFISGLHSERMPNECQFLNFSFDGIKCGFLTSERSIY